MTTTENDYRDCPTAWFATLERAIGANDFALAAQAKAELKRLGVEVHFEPKRCFVKGANDAK